MAQKALEIVVRDMQKVIGVLCDKIDRLEMKIDEQSRIIALQNKVPSSQKTLAEGKQESVGQNIERPVPTITAEEDLPQPAAAALQRPIRQARIKAAENKVSGQLSAVGKKPVAKLQRASLTPKAPEIVRTEPNLIPSTLPPPPPPIMNRGELIGASAAGTLAKSEVGKIDTAREPEGERDQWQVVSRQQRRKNQQQRITIGVGKENDDIQAIERVKYIQAWSFRPDTTAEKVTSFLNNIKKSEYIVKKRDIKSELHASFLIGMPESVYDEVTSPTKWPPRVRFVPWIPFRPRPRHGWGPERAEAGASA